MMQFLAGWIALGCGLLNLALAKGTRGHRAFGLLFVIGMCLAAIAAISRGAIDLFAGLVLLGGALTIWALLPFVDRRRGWVVRHARRMQAAYVALACAGTNEAVSLVLPGRATWLLTAAAILFIAVIGGWLASHQQAEIRRVTATYE